MIVRSVLRAGVVLAVVGSAACGGTSQSPTNPTAAAGGSDTAAADGSTLKVTAPALIAPIGGARVDSLQPTLSWAASTATFANTKSARIASESDKSLRVLDVLRNSAAQRFQLTKQSSQPIPNARVRYVSETGSLIFQGANLDQLPAGKVYELWLIPVGDGRTPIPAGTFRPDERGYASIVLPDFPKGVVAGTFGVTMEDEGGAKNPTLPILMIGA